MMLWGAKGIGLFIALFFAVGFMSGVIHYNRDATKCLVPRHWQEGSWHTFFAIGRLELRVRDYDCDQDFKLDPKLWKNNGLNTVVPTN